MQVENVKIGDVKPYERNPRKNAKAVGIVANSIQQYGFQQPIVVDKNMVIIVGHTRYAAARHLKLTEVPVLVSKDLTVEQVNAYRIMDNRSNENSYWDEDLLLQELTDLIDKSNMQDLSFNTGMTESELEKLFRDDTDVVAAANNLEYFKSKEGDVFTLGDHKIICGDSTKAEDLNKLLGKEKVDMVWEDPPYGIAYRTVTSINRPDEWIEANCHKIENDDLTPDELNIFLDSHLKVLMSHVKAGGPFYVCHDIRMMQLLRDVMVKNKIHVSDTLIWKKAAASNFLCDYSKHYEPIIYGWKEGAEHPWFGYKMQKNAFDLDELDKKTKEQLIEILKLFVTNVQEVAKEPHRIATLHPTVKPTKLITYHIINSSKPGEIVFDGFSGSGSTLIACEKTQRKARCVEYEPKFVDVTINRWQELTGLKATRQDGELFDDITTGNDYVI